MNVGQPVRLLEVDARANADGYGEPGGVASEERAEQRAEERADHHAQESRRKERANQGTREQSRHEADTAQHGSHGAGLKVKGEMKRT